MATDPFAFWRAQLAGSTAAGNVDDPQLGFYRYRRKGKSPDDAVAYTRRNDGTMMCVVNGYEAHRPDAGLTLWSHVSASAVSHQDYLHRIQRGSWPNENVVVLGHNRPPEENSEAALVSVLDALKAEAQRILKGGVAKTQDEADQASDVANELLDVEKKAIAAHRAEKAPLLAETKRVDKKWFVIRDYACDLKEQIRFRVVTPFLTKLKREAEEAAREAAQYGETPPEVRVAAGSLKRTTGLRTVVSAKITDYPAALAYFEPHPEVRELIQTLANRAVRAGTSVPGCERIEEERAV